jgi:hypothetical protein
MKISCLSDFREHFNKHPNRYDYKTLKRMVQNLHYYGEIDTEDYI